MLLSAQEVLDRAARLRQEAQEECAAAKATLARIAALVRTQRFLRVFYLARGANDGPLETSFRVCPHCQSTTVAPNGRVSIAAGLLKAAYHCADCAKPFVFLRRPA